MSSETSHDPAASDLYWAGPSGWAMLPIAIGVGTISGLSWLGVPYLADLLGLDHEWTTFILFQTILLTWIIFGLHWAYRAACVVTRLTRDYLYFDYGFLYRPTPPIALTELTDVRVVTGLLGQWLHVGNVVVVTRQQRQVIIAGLYHPEAFAQAIRQTMQKATTA